MLNLVLQDYIHIEYNFKHYSLPLLWLPSTLYVTEFWKGDPNQTFVFCYISHYHMVITMSFEIFLTIMWNL